MTCYNHGFNTDAHGICMSCGQPAEPIDFSNIYKDNREATMSEYECTNPDNCPSQQPDLMCMAKKPICEYAKKPTPPQREQGAVCPVCDGKGWELDDPSCGTMPDFEPSKTCKECDGTGVNFPPQRDQGVVELLREVLIEGRSGGWLEGSPLDEKLIEFIGYVSMYKATPTQSE